MINIINKIDCCGCWACVQRCPKNCIEMREDQEGFIYPTVDQGTCIQCGLCEQVCPVLNQSDPRKPIQVYAAKNRNEAVRYNSSSGGVFTPLAENIIAQKGVVFGAKFDSDWTVVHGYTETIEGIADFRGSKYVQSSIGECYRQAEVFLKEGREVLFSGTPCQIAGLHKFLMREYPNLLTVDVVCHGVPSPMIWREYLKSLICPKDSAGQNTVLSAKNTMSVIGCIKFRDKRLGWKKHGFEVRWTGFKTDKKQVLGYPQYSENYSLYEPLTKNLYMWGFLANLYLRPSCHACSARQGKSCSDLTIADFWGIANYRPDFDDDKGVGLVFINTKKAESVYPALKLESAEMTYTQALAGNQCIEHSQPTSTYQTRFWSLYNIHGIASIALIYKEITPSLFCRGLNFGKRLILRIIGRQ